MRKLKDLSVVLASLIVCIVVISLSEVALAEENGIIFRGIDSHAFKNNAPAAKFEHDDCFVGKGALSIDLSEAPLLMIPDDQIDAMKLFSPQCTDFPYSSLLIEIKKKYADNLKKVSEACVKKNIALFIDDDFIYSPHVYEPIEDVIQIGSCLSYEKAVAIMINHRFKPNYEETCIGGKKIIENLSAKYKFKKNYIEEKKYYQPLLSNSEFWYIKIEAPLFDKPNGNQVAIIPLGKVVEQFYNSKMHLFERGPGWIKILYQGKDGWIREKYVLPLFSILNSNLFLEKFFVFNEYRYKNLREHKAGYSDYMIGRVNNIRKLYIEEALARFEDPDEFKDWYLDTFKESFAK